MMRSLITVGAVILACGASAFCQPRLVGPELVTNGGFEGGGSAWTDSIEIVEAPVHSGDHAARLETVSADKAVAVQQYWVPIEPRKHYRFRMAMRRTTGDGYVYVRIIWKKGPEELLMSSETWHAGYVPIATVRTGEAVGHWQELGGTFRAERTDVAGLKITVIISGGADTVYLDDVSIREVEYPPASEWEIPDAVIYPGHPSAFGMSVEGADRDGDVFTVTTTGARYAVDARAGVMTCHQRIGAQREVAVADFGVPLTGLRIGHRNSDVCVLEGRDLALGFQGDSLVTVATNRTLRLGVEGRFGARHLRTLDPHLLAIDAHGGVCVMPWARPDLTSPGSRMVAGPEDAEEPGWSAHWEIGERELVGIGVFPPRHFDWRSSFDRRIVFVNGEDSLTAESLEGWAQHASLLTLFAAIYKEHQTGYRYRLPYRADDPEKLRETVGLAHELGMEAICYRAPIWYGQAEISPEHTVADMEQFRARFGFDGWYLDGHYDTYDWMTTWVMMRRLREAVGDGPIYTHCTINPPIRIPELYCPFIDAYSDFLLRGEAQIIRGPEDPYLRYVIGTRFISNSIATLKGNEMRAGTDAEEMASMKTKLETMLKLNGRARWAYPHWPLEESDRLFTEFFFPELDRREALLERTGDPPEMIWP